MKIKTILLLEDENSVRFELSFFLRALGYKVLDVSNTLTFYKALVRESVDLIIFGMMQPYEDGFEILKRLKTVDLYKNIPIIISSKVSNDLVIKETLRLGACHYIKRENRPIKSCLRELKTVIDFLNI